MEQSAPEYADGVNLGTSELLIILAIVAVIFGADRLPKLARSLAQAQRELRDAADGRTEDASPSET